ncbi:MAG: hemolysin family protein [Kiritimatiellales bacterium]
MNTPQLTYSIVALLIAGFWAILFSAFRETGNAGILRLVEKKPHAKAVFERWAERWNLLRITLLFCLTLFEIAAVYFAVRALRFEHSWEWALLIVGLTLLYILFIRVIPYVLAESYADRLSLFFLPLVTFCARILTPVVWPFYAFERRLLKHALSTAKETDRPSPEEEIMSLVDEADDQELEEDERDIIRGVFELNETVVREIMTPRVSIEGLRAEATVQECVDKIIGSRHSRFPVYAETIDNVSGIVHVKDLFRPLARGETSAPVSTIAKKMHVVPETMPINDLLHEMQERNFQMALVVDEYGGTAGIISMEDIIEELIGEIHDEYDLAEKELQKRSDGSILVKASYPVADLNEELNLEIPESDEYDSIGGYVLNELGIIPPAGTKITAPGVVITVQTATLRRIDTLLLVPNE